MDKFNNARWGYKSNMAGFEEEHMFKSFRALYALENDLEMAKQQLIIDSPNFTVDQGMKLFDPPKDAKETFGFENI